MATSKQAKEDVGKEEVKAEKQAMEAEEELEQPPTGPTLSPIEPRPVEAPTLAEAGEPQANPNTYDDGVVDIELGPPVLGQFVRIEKGDYAGRFAAYLGDVSYEEPETVDPRVAPTPAMIQVRTRDADNLVLDVPYADVSSTTYSGGR